jgi:phage terminase large subunit GpA-like protein
LAQSKWRDSISPAIQASPALRALQMPKHSMGSLDSGRQFRNGATLYMIGADSESAGTSRSVEIVLVDELDMIARPKTGQNDPVDKC